MRTLTTIFLGCGLLLVLGAAARADEQADCKALIEKAVKARGGLDKLAKLRAGTTRTKGTFHGMGVPIPFTSKYSVQHPDKVKQEIEGEFMGMQFSIVVVFNGKEGWRKSEQGLQEFNAAQVAEQKHGLHAGSVTSLAPLLKEDGFKFTALGEAKVEAKPAVGVRVAKQGQRDVCLYFDKDTGLLVKSEIRVKPPDQDTELTQETLYADYKDVNGIKHPMKQTVHRDGKVFIESEVLEVKPVDKLDDSVFSKPSEG